MPNETNKHYDNLDTLLALQELEIDTSTTFASNDKNITNNGKTLPMIWYKQQHDSNPFMVHSHRINIEENVVLDSFENNLQIFEK